VTRRKFNIVQEVHLTISRIAMKEREEKLKRHRDIEEKQRRKDMEVGEEEWESGGTAST